MGITTQTSLSVEQICRKSKESSLFLAGLTAEKKNIFLKSLADRLLSETDSIIKYNHRDLTDGEKAGLTSSLIDRLRLDEERIKTLAASVMEVASLPDPVGEISHGVIRPNGLKVYQERVPLGTVMVIFESRPNVTVDISALAIKSGNAVILKGGKEAIATNSILTQIIQKTLDAEGLPSSAVNLILTSDREELKKYLQQTPFIDVVVPRGGEKLIEWVSEHSRIPVIKHDKGLCHLFIDNIIPDGEVTDFRRIVNEVTVNSKVQRPGVCNAIETLLIHSDYPYTEEVLTALSGHGVELRLDKNLYGTYSGYSLAQEEDWMTEYLDLILSVKSVQNTKEAVNWINHYSSHHTDVILSQSYSNIIYFQKYVDSSCVVVNASSRFNDGGMLGLGAEVGISNQKLHVRGPMGIRDLTCLKYHVEGSGQIRT